MKVPADRLIFFGTDRFSVPSLQALLEAGYNVVGVVTKPDMPIGRGRVLTAPLVKQLAIPYRIPVLQPAKLADAWLELSELKPDAGIVVAYGKIIPQSVIDLFPKGLINVHGSLLPKYRGASPIEAALLNGDAQTGVSLMRINDRMDAGDVYQLCKYPLQGNETKPQLYDDLSHFGARELTKHLPAILDGSLNPQPQNEAAATYVSRITKEAGQLDLSKPAAQLEREIRAYQGWPGSRTSLHGTDVIVTAAHVADAAPAKEPVLKTSQGYLVIDRLKPAGKREMTGREFIAGRR